MEKSARPSTHERPFLLQWSSFAGGLVNRASQNPAMAKIGPPPGPPDMGINPPFPYPGPPSIMGGDSRLPIPRPGPAKGIGWYGVSGHAELVDILNFKYESTPDGVKLRQREGLAKLSTVAAAGGAIKDIGYYVSEAGTGYTVIVADSDLSYLNAGAFTKIGDLSSTRGRLAVFSNKLIVADSKVLKYWDATTFGILQDLEGGVLDDLTGNYERVSLSYDPLFATEDTLAGQKVTFATWAGAALTASVNKATFYLAKVGTPPGTMACRIYAADGTTLLGTSTAITANSLLTTPAFIEFSFATAVTVSPNTAYYIVVAYSDAGSDVSNCVRLYFYTADQTTGKQVHCSGFFASKKGITWTDAASWDSVYSIGGGLAPFGDFVVNYKNRLWANDNRFPNRLYFSNVNDPFDWSTTDAAGYIICDGSYQIVGLAALNDILLIFMDKPRRTLKLTGTSPSDFSITPLIEGISTVTQDTIIPVEDDIIFIDKQGIFSARKLEEGDTIEAGLISKPINGLILPYCTSSLFSGKLVADRQYWVCYLTNNILVFDAELGIYTKYVFSLGTSVNPTAFGTVDGVTYVGDSAGHLWKMDLSSPVWQDGTNNYTLYFKTGMEYLGTNFVKQAVLVDAFVYAGSSGTFKVDLYKDLATSATQSHTMNNIVAGTLTKNFKWSNLEFNYIQVYAYDWTSSKGRIDIDRVLLEGSLLSRY